MQSMRVGLEIFLLPSLTKVEIKQQQVLLQYNHSSNCSGLI